MLIVEVLLQLIGLVVANFDVRIFERASDLRISNIVAIENLEAA